VSATDFLNTNVLVYAFSTDPRNLAAMRLLESGCCVSTQGFNEFSNIARRKLGMSWPDIRVAIGAIRTLSVKIVVPDVATHERALLLAERHNFAIFDAHMIATALAADCLRFWSEDLHAGMVVEERLTISNPFRL